MPTIRPRHVITEADDIERTLAGAARERGVAVVELCYSPYETSLTDASGHSLRRLDCIVILVSSREVDRYAARHGFVAESRR